MNTPSIEIITRTFCGHETQLLANLVSTLNLFVDRSNYNFTIVLDDENHLDHALGERILENELADFVLYEPLPNNWQQLFQGISFPPPYNRWGYDRQQWSTFYMDKYTSSDIVGVVDSDSTFFSYLTPQNILTSDNRIKLFVIHDPNNTPEDLIAAQQADPYTTYPNNSVALGERCPYKTMITHIMPLWFWRSTFENLRRHIAQKWDMEFDEAFKQISQSGYSQFDILVNYAILYEPEKYEWLFADDPTANLVSVGQNGCRNKHDILTGGIRSFEIEKRLLPRSFADHFESCQTDAIHINRESYCKFGGIIQNEKFVAEHYRNVHALLPPGSQDRRNRLDSFIAFMTNGFHNIIGR